MSHITKKTYSWGAVVTIREGIKFSCTLHPEHLETVLAIPVKGEGSFTDEQGLTWTVTRGGEFKEDNQLTFVSGHRRLSTTVEALEGTHRVEPSLSAGYVTRAMRLKDDGLN